MKKILLKSIQSVILSCLLIGCSDTFGNLGMSQISTPNNAKVEAAGLFNKVKALETHIYPTYGTEEQVVIKGRVLEKDNIAESKSTDSHLRNLINNIDLLTTDEQKNIYVDVKFNAKVVKVQTNKEGFFEVKFTKLSPVQKGLNKVEVSLASNQKKYTADTTTEYVIIKPKSDTGIGIITDIDDTIQKSDVTHKFQFIGNIFFENYTTQPKIPGISELYNAIDLNSGNIDGDVYYVSSSPVNIFPRLKNFLKYNNFPYGSLDMRILEGPGSDGLGKTLEYKLKKIRPIFLAYPSKKFLLFGDSGEKDPEIYKQAATEFPGRVTGIYINNVTKEDKNSARFNGMLLTNNTADAASDLFTKGLITRQDLEAVKKAVNQK